MVGGECSCSKGIIHSWTNTHTQKAQTTFDVKSKSNYYQLNCKQERSVLGTMTIYFQHLIILWEVKNDQSCLTPTLIAAFSRIKYELTVWRKQRGLFIIEVNFLHKKSLWPAFSIQLRFISVGCKKCMMMNAKNVKFKSSVYSEMQSSTCII